ncbi:hypothetical protein NQ314_006791 [Rhamnusium bicolor]|uniref:Uncharacterized protein n=1 Tax=Rhamnusium bicolor TaxID=1586634 RepID=A0AAV8YYX6_9CUCU|nr:hypothetical protein NQ314_006791 [Rhamnusium bicolor]
MVIDFEGPKKDKPSKLSSSFICQRKSKVLNKSGVIGKCNGSLSCSVNSINSSSVASTSRQSVEQEVKSNSKEHVSIEVLSASLVKNLSVSSKSSSSSENIVMEKTNNDLERDSAKESVEEEHIEQDCDSEKIEDDNILETCQDGNKDQEDQDVENKINKTQVSIIIKELENCSVQFGNT